MSHIMRNSTFCIHAKNKGVKTQYIAYSTANIKTVGESLWSISVIKLSPLPKLQSVSVVCEKQ